MKKFLSVAFATIASLLLIFAILFTSMDYVIGDQTFLENEFTKLNISHAMGISNTDLVKSTVRLISYMQGEVPDINVDVTLNGETVPMFALEQEHTHMKDVQQIYLQIKGYRDTGVLAMLVLFLLAAVINFKKAQQTLAQGYLSGAFIALLFIGFLGTWALSDFSSFWTFFHEALFWNDLWLFDTTSSRMINMLPEQLFSDMVGRIFLYAGTAIAVLIAVSVLALIFTSKSYKKKRAEIIRQQKARKAAVAAATRARAEARAEMKTTRAKAKAEREKEKRLAEKRKAKEKAQKKKSGGKGQRPAPEAARPKKKAAAEETQTFFDEAPAAYVEDEDGYPAASGGAAADGLPEDGGEVASIDDILSTRKKPWQDYTRPAAEIAPAEMPKEKPLSEPAQPEEQYAVLTGKGYVLVDEGDDAFDAPEASGGAPDEKRGTGRTKRPVTEKKPRGHKSSVLNVAKKSLQKAAKAAQQTKDKSKKQKKDNHVQDDTGFFDD